MLDAPTSRTPSPRFHKPDAKSLAERCGGDLSHAIEMLQLVSAGQPCGSPPRLPATKVHLNQMHLCAADYLLLWCCHFQADGVVVSSLLTHSPERMQLLASRCMLTFCSSQHAGAGGSDDMPVS